MCAPTEEESDAWIVQECTAPDDNKFTYFSKAAQAVL